MKTFQEFINEASEYQVYMVDKEFWLAYGQSSGTTAQISNMDTFLTNKSGDKNYDSIVNGVVKKFVTYSEPQMVRRSEDKLTKYSLYYLPAYKGSDVRQGKMKIWGGDVEPFTTHYMLVVQGEKYDIIQFFKTKGEAKAYVNSLK